MQGPIGVFVHHNTLHAFQDLPFEQGVIEASHLFGAEPYMAEAAYRAELARGRIHLEDIDAVLDSEPDAVVFPRLSRHSLRRAMMTPGVREFDAATILWRAEQGDLARDFRQTDWEEVLQAELLALPGWAGLMRRLEEDPDLAPHETVPCSLMDFLAVRLTMTRVASREGAAETIPQENPLKSQEKRRLSRAARVYDAARVLSLSADEITRLCDDEWAAFVSEVKTC